MRASRPARVGCLHRLACGVRADHHVRDPAGGAVRPASRRPRLPGAAGVLHHLPAAGAHRVDPALRYDRLLVPRLRRLTGRDDGITLLQRMGVSMVLSVVAMLVAGLVEQRSSNLSVRQAAAAAGEPMSRHLVSPASAIVLVPQLATLGLSEAFNHVSQMEFYYKQLLSSYLSGPCSSSSCTAPPPTPKSRATEAGSPRTSTRGRVDVRKLGPCRGTRRRHQ